jgi:hypothetical protein
VSILLPNESFHSLLLRYYLREGDYSKILSGVISSKGYWRKPSELAIPDYILKLSATTRFEIIRKTLIISEYVYRKDTDLFAFNIVGSSYRMSYSYISIFRSGHINFPINRNIKYCCKCIRKSIKKFGVGYFKREWILENSHGCQEHGSILNTLTIDKGEVALDKILNVLSGRIPTSEGVANLRPLNRKPFNALKKHLSISTNCLWNEVIVFIQHFIINTFKQYEIENLNGDYKRAFKIVSTPKGKPKFLTWINEVSIVNFMVNNFHIELRSFLSDNAECSVKERLMNDGSKISYCSSKFIQARCNSCTEDATKCLRSLKIDTHLVVPQNRYILNKSNLYVFHKRRYKLA